MFVCACDANQTQTSVTVETEKLPVNEVLRDKLDAIIDFNESQADKSSTITRANSYWIGSTKDGDSISIMLMANFDFYDSSEMVGYFRYRDKFISVYDISHLTEFGFVDTSLLESGAITELKDYAADETMVYPHSPYFMRYSVHSKDSLVLTLEGK